VWSTKLIHMRGITPGTLEIKSERETSSSKYSCSRCGPSLSLRGCKVMNCGLGKIIGGKWMYTGLSNHFKASLALPLRQAKLHDQIQHKTTLKSPGFFFNLPKKDKWGKKHKYIYIFSPSGILILESTAKSFLFSCQM